MVKRAPETSPDALARLLREKRPDEQLTEELFLATLSRPPSAVERDAVHRALAEGDAREEVYRDLFWALLNSQAFAFNH